MIQKWCTMITVLSGEKKKSNEALGIFALQSNAILLSIQSFGLLTFSCCLVFSGPLFSISVVLSFPPGEMILSLCVPDQTHYLLKVQLIFFFFLFSTLKSHLIWSVTSKLSFLCWLFTHLRCFFFPFGTATFCWDCLLENYWMLRIFELRVL